MTETQKWANPFFRDKCPVCKLFWLFVLDQCSYAGIWQVDYRLAEFSIGGILDRDFIEKDLSDKIVIIDGGQRWFIPSFIKFQYGNQLSKRNQIHMRVIKEVINRNLDDYLLDQGVEIVDEIESSTAIRQRITEKYRLSLYSRDEFTCQYCSNQFIPQDLTLDHIIPISKNKNNPNREDNLVTACKICNARKSDDDLEVFLYKNNELKPKQAILDRVETSVVSLSTLDKEAIVSRATPKDKEEEEEEGKVKEEVKEEEEEKEKDTEEIEYQDQDAIDRIINEIDQG